MNNKMSTLDRATRFTRNLEWLEQVEKVIPSGCSTLAKAPERLFPGHTPVCCAEAYHSRFTDIDGNEWLDCEMAMGTAPWGHARREIQLTVIHQLKKGTSFSIPADIELECAELILERFEGRYASLRFTKSGADAVSGAVRIARAASGKSKVIATAYHGWHDWSAYGYYGSQTKERGIPKDIERSTIWIKKPAYEQIKEQISSQEDVACIVLCPNEWRKEELADVVTLCSSKDIIIIFDEVTSGIRMGKQATAGEYDIWPDLLCISKGMANGLPLAAVLGPEHMMSLAGQVRFSNAHSSETIALAAAIACERLMKNTKVWPTWREPATRIMKRLESELILLGLTDELTLKGTYASFYIQSIDEQNFQTDPFREFMVKKMAYYGIFTKGYFIFSDTHTREELIWVEEALLQILSDWKEKKKQEHLKHTNV
ncbi:aminotransferase class III-fold pyridoxal phosphate-dependent enzyme [Paenibacillus barcinonensis]|uniref:aminotransferase class III-fold pyridoxal phosphate-dependent enzyme n=1 Tax=Paenibacillus TaxID=44249 RepID=UPI001C128510|nr:aminotransferase class III-fold pyridoxal phosphate-dependent enzyme [Paenibacillus silvae]MBU5351457.1 aminotransferase class III-fold pyridoxal phosphate-dependent enzyme [Paenibacillus barcinonensis]MDM5277920.1 aminotransferase class III-fold pyridoxal phosphate-dependent enzyme [Paenibacillus silvae]